MCIQLKNIFFGRAVGSLLPSRLVRAAVLGLVMLAPPAAVEAQTLASLPSSRFTIKDLGAAKPLQAWTKFCETNPSECAVDTSQPMTIDLTPQVWKTLNAVNQHVNATIQPVTDMDHWGVVDLWSFPDDGKGDCEDFQLLKRRLLAEKGLPRRAMRMTVVIDELGEGHAVLMIRTDKGDYILDNKTNSILPWDRTGYVYIKRESQTATAWVSLGGITSPTVASPTTTANR